MRIGVTSDLHGALPAVEECDIFLICGDIMPLNIQLNMPKSRLWLQNTFIPWANGLPCKWFCWSWWWAWPYRDWETDRKSVV